MYMDFLAKNRRSMKHPSKAVLGIVDDLFSLCISWKTIAQKASEADNLLSKTIWTEISQIKFQKTKRDANVLQIKYAKTLKLLGKPDKNRD